VNPLRIEPLDELDHFLFVNILSPRVRNETRTVIVEIPFVNGNGERVPVFNRSGNQQVFMVGLENFDFEATLRGVRNEVVVSSRTVEMSRSIASGESTTRFIVESLDLKDSCGLFSNELTYVE
jgi:hypothetical protein